MCSIVTCFEYNWYLIDTNKEPGVISDGFTIPKTICNTIRYYEYYGKVFGGTLLLHRETRKKNKLRRELFSIVLLLRSHPSPGFLDWSPTDREIRSKKVTPKDWVAQAKWPIKRWRVITGDILAAWSGVKTSRMWPAEINTPSLNWIHSSSLNQYLSFSLSD